MNNPCKPGIIITNVTKIVPNANAPSRYLLLKNLLVNITGLSDLQLNPCTNLPKHSVANAIVLAKGRQLIASGVGQTSRVDALNHAIEKARSFGFDLNGAVMASDAFFPFPDCVEIAGEAGITAVIQPGGSIKDSESIDMCNQKGMSMVTTGIRHFKH